MKKTAAATMLTVRVVGIGCLFIDGRLLK